MLKLREFAARDAQTIAAWIGGEETFLWWSAGKLGDYPLTAQRLIDFYAAAAPGEDWMPLVMEDDGRLCGSMLMRRVEAARIHFGFIVVDGSVRGKGYGSGMLRLALERAFDVPGVRRVTLNVFADNAPAIACYERLGFVRGAEIAIEVGGQALPAVVYEFTAQDK